MTAAMPAVNLVMMAIVTPTSASPFRANGCPKSSLRLEQEGRHDGDYNCNRSGGEAMARTPLTGLRGWVALLRLSRAILSLGPEITTMKLCNSMDEFKEKFARAFKKSPQQLSLFDFDLAGHG
jgi:hypothetical protein